MAQRRQKWAERGWTGYQEVQIGAAPALNGHSTADAQSSTKPAASIPVRVYGEHVEASSS